MAKPKRKKYQVGVTDSPNISDAAKADIKKTVKAAAAKKAQPYKKAKDTDPNLALYIKKRKELRAKGFTTKDPELAKIQNAINKAYGSKKRYEVNEVSRKEDGYPAIERARAEKEKKSAASIGVKESDEVTFEKKPVGPRADGQGLKETTSKTPTAKTPTTPLKGKAKRKNRRAERRNKPVKTTAAAKADKALDATTNRPMRGGGSTYTQLKYKKDGTVKKHKTISEKKFKRLSGRYAGQEGSESLGTSKSRVQQTVSGRNPRKSVSRQPAKKSKGGMRDRRK